MVTEKALPCGLTKDDRVILFDGVCNLCNGWVQFVIKRDPAKRILFASIQGDSGQAILTHYGMSTSDFDTMVVIENGQHYIRSTAALTAVRWLSGLWFLFAVFLIVPRFIRDFCYNRVAKNRYKMFGESESCWLPTPELRERFLDSRAPVV